MQCRRNQRQWGGGRSEEGGGRREEGGGRREEGGGRREEGGRDVGRVCGRRRPRVRERPEPPFFSRHACPRVMGPGGSNEPLFN